MLENVINCDSLEGGIRMSLKHKLVSLIKVPLVKAAVKLNTSRTHNFLPMIVRLNKSNRKQNTYSTVRKTYEQLVINNMKKTQLVKSVCFMVNYLHLLKILVDISPFCGSTDTPILDFQ